jgi:hypothetical protein
VSERQGTGDRLQGTGKAGARCRKGRGRRVANRGSEWGRHPSPPPLSPGERVSRSAGRVRGFQAGVHGTRNEKPQREAGAFPGGHRPPLQMKRAGTRPAPTHLLLTVDLGPGGPGWSFSLAPNP